MTRRLTAATALAFAAALALSGCGGQGGNGQGQGSSTPVPDAVTEVTNEPGTGQGFEGAADDVTNDTCQRSGDAWNVGGTVTNSAAEPRSYRIYVALLSSTETRAMQEVAVDTLQPGAKTDWSATIPVAEDNLSCVLRVERYGADGAPVSSEAPADTEAPAEGEGEG